jgi:hypothetical protein
MDNLITYLIRCVLVSGLLTGYYVLALRGRRMHGFNRLYLLSSVVLALVLPLVRIPWAPWALSSTASAARVFVRTAPAAGVRNGVALWWLLGMGAALLVSLVLLFASIVKIRAIYRLRRTARCTPMDGYEFVETEAPGTPFSFLRYLFWRRGVGVSDTVHQKMLAHELAHIRGRHSWDILGLQAVLCLFWMNPFFWYIRRELHLVLEFSADAASGAEGDPEVLAQMLLYAFEGGRYSSLVHGFFHSPIKRRLVMITNNNGSRRAWMRMALALPVLGAAVLVFSCSKEQQPQQAMLSPLIVSDGHMKPDTDNFARITLQRFKITGGKTIDTIHFTGNKIITRDN